MAVNNSSPYSVFYDSPYFSGSQAGVYIGDVYIDEITSISYRGSQQKTPVYGYASQLFDRVAAGPFIIQGEFTINFKESAYLWAVLERYNQMIRQPSDPNQTTVPLLGPLPNSELGNSVKRMFNARPVRSDTEDSSGPVQAGVEYVRSGVPVGREAGTGITNVISFATIEDLLEDKATLSERTQIFTEIANSVGAAATSQNLQKDQKKLFDALVENVRGKANIQDTGFERTDDNKYDGFDLYVTFGDWENPNAPRTVQRLSQVHLTSRGTSVEISGAPIQEHYSFIARNIR